METWVMVEKSALQKELNVLKVMEAKYRLEEKSNTLKTPFPNKYIDEELMFMKEIRKAYFEPTSKELKQLDQNKKMQAFSKSKPYEIMYDSIDAERKTFTQLISKPQHSANIVPPQKSIFKS